MLRGRSKQTPTWCCALSKRGGMTPASLAVCLPWVARQGVETSGSGAATLTCMKVRFERTRQRRYAVAVIRSQHGDLRMDPAPGFSELIPHDLVHLVVEEEFGLRDGIFGQLAAGGNAGTFVPTEELRTKAWARRVERLNRSTGTDMGRSEALAAQVYPRWLRRSGHLPGSHYVRQEPPPTDLSDTDLDRAFTRLDVLSGQWRAVDVGASLSVEWRWPERP